MLESFGFLVVRVTNVDVYDNLDGVLEMIDQNVSGHVDTPSPLTRPLRGRPLPTGERSIGALRRRPMVHFESPPLRRSRIAARRMFAVPSIRITIMPAK